MALKIGDICDITSGHIKLLILLVEDLFPYIKVSSIVFYVRAGEVVTERCLSKSTLLEKFIEEITNTETIF